MKIIAVYIFTVIYSPLRGFIWNQHNDQLPFGLLTQLVERCPGIANVMSSNLLRAKYFFPFLIEIELLRLQIKSELICL